MASELTVLARALKTIAGSDRRTRDFTLTALRSAIVEVVACFPVYRTYVTRVGLLGRGPRDHRPRHRSGAAPQSGDGARRCSSSCAACCSPTATSGTSSVPVARRQFAMKFQQFSAPVQAKGVEDTSFYRYNALAVAQRSRRRSGAVRHAGRGVSRRQPRPARTLAARDDRDRDARHQTRRGRAGAAERAVGNAGEWRRAVSRLAQDATPSHRTAVDRRSAPDAERRVSVLSGARRQLAGRAASTRRFPPRRRPISSRACSDYMQKAIKEAKTHTSWINQNSAYEDAVSRFVETTLSGSAAPAFLAAFVPFVRRVAAAGMVNSLAQLVLKIASPGVPDFFQGTETWQLGHGRPRQPPAGRFCVPRGDARRADALDPARRVGEPMRMSRPGCGELEQHVARTAGRLAGRPDQNVRHGLCAAAPAPRAVAVHRRPLRGAAVRRTACLPTGGVREDSRDARQSSPPCPG